MGTYQMFMSCLVSLAVAGDVVVVARKSEAVGMGSSRPLRSFLDIIFALICGV